MTIDFGLPDSVAPRHWTTGLVGLLVATATVVLVERHLRPRGAPPWAAPACGFAAAWVSCEYVVRGLRWLLGV